MGKRRGIGREKEEKTESKSAYACEQTPIDDQIASANALVTKAIRQPKRVFPVHSFVKNEDCVISFMFSLRTTQSCEVFGQEDLSFSFDELQDEERVENKPHRCFG